MTTGLELYFENGQLLSSTTTSIAAFLGTRNNASGFTVTDNLFLLGTPWYFYIPRSVYIFGNPSFGIPSVSFSGNTMTVTGSNFNGVFYFGVY